MWPSIEQRRRGTSLQLLIDNPGVIFENLTVHVISKIARETMLLLYTTTNSLSQDYSNLLYLYSAYAAHYVYSNKYILI